MSALVIVLAMRQTRRWQRVAHVDKCRQRQQQHLSTHSWTRGAANASRAAQRGA